MKQKVHRIICLIFGHKPPNYKRAGCFVYCKRCKKTLELVGSFYGVKFIEINEVKST